MKTVSFAGWTVGRASLAVYLVAVLGMVLACVVGRVPLDLTGGDSWVVILWDAAYITIAVMLIGVPAKRFLVSSYRELSRRL